MIRFLIDECLSPALAETARARGFEATHVVWLGRASTADRDLAALALERDYVIVTNNARDFLRLFRRIELHPGLIVILPELDAPRQRTFFTDVLDFVEAHPDIVNLVVTIDAERRISATPWSAGHI